MKLNVTVIPNAKSYEVIKTDESNYKVRVDATAAEGKANRRLIEILAEYFEIKKSSISIIRGLKDKNKIIEINL
jgi:hypothetical protein